MQGTVKGLFSVVQDAKVVQYCAIDFTEQTVGECWDISSADSPLSPSVNVQVQS